MIDRQLNELNIDCLQELKSHLIQIGGLDETENSYKIHQILSRFDSLLTREVGSRVDGHIEKLIAGHSNGVSYGFVFDNKCNRYFFSRYALIPRHILDDRIGEKDISVSFTIGKNDKGYIAENVEVASSNS